MLKKHCVHNFPNEDPKSSSDRFYSLAELAEICRADRSSVRRWLREAGVKAFVFGSGRNAAVRFRATDVEAWLASRATVA